MKTMATTTPSIQDTGAFLPGAKKHEVKAPQDARTQAGKLLQQLWPEPDWAQRIKAGLAPQTAALLHILYQGFATAPMRPGAWQIDGDTHKAFYEKCVAQMRALFDQATTEDVDELCRKFHAATGVPRDIKGLPIEKLLPLYALGRYGGRTLKSPFSLTYRSRHLSRAIADLGWPEDTRALKTGICHWKNGANGAYGVARFSANAFQELEKAVHSKHAAISHALRHIAQDIERDQRERKSIPRKARSKDLERRGGADVRQGENITPEQLMQRYRLRAIQFGESLSQPERQNWMNQAYDALQDLADAVDMPPAWIGLSRLGLALGARGSSGTSAHFEPRLRVINLTRMNGAGSLGHEWAHGLDNHLAVYTMGLSPSPGAGLYLSDLSWQLASLRRDDPSKSAIALRMLRIVNYMKSGRLDAIEDGETSEYMRAAKKIEGLKGARKAYWTSPLEMFARAFEATVQDRLAEAGVYSPWLVQGTLASDLPAGAAADPYPQGADRKILGQLIGELLKAIVAAAARPPAS